MFKILSKSPLELKRFIDVEKPVNEIATKRLTVSRENERFRDVINLMVKKFRRIPIVDNQNHLKGIITATDVLDILGGGEKNKIFLRHRRSFDMPVRKVMERHVITIDRKIPIRRALEIFKKSEIGAYPVVHKKKLVGIVSEWDFVKQIREDINLSVEDLMVRKPMIAKPDYSLLDTAKLMCRGGFRRLPVVENNILLGIVTPKDIIKYLSEMGGLGKLAMVKTKTAEVMNKNVVIVDPQTELFAAIKVMKNKGIGGLPVTEEDELVGILTERDIVDAFL